MKRRFSIILITTLALCSLHFQLLKANSQISPDSLQYATTKEELLAVIPKSLHSCIPTSVSGGKLWSEFKNSQGSYYLLGLLQPKAHPYNNYIETVILVSNSRCQIMVPLAEASFFPLSNYIDSSIARQLVLQKYRQEMKERGGKQALIANVFQDTEDPSLETYFFPEDVWALEQLGIYLPYPSNIVIIGPEGIPPNRRN